VTFTHIAQDWEITRQEEPPEIDLNVTTPRCDEHEISMTLQMMCEGAVPEESLLFRCPVSGCSNLRWIM